MNIQKQQEMLQNFIAPTWVLGIPKIIKIPIKGINISHDKIKSNIIDLVLR